MALWRDPLDELIGELERVVPPEPPEKKPAPEELLRFLARLQAESARIVFGPEATLSLEEFEALPPKPVPVSQTESAGGRFFRRLQEDSEWHESQRAGTTAGTPSRPDGQSKADRPKMRSQS